MTNRASRRKGRSRAVASAAGVSRAAFPALTGFLQGYLHEDYAELHGSARGAVAAFCAEATSAERRALAKELAALLEVTAALPLSELRRVVTSELGGAWTPGSRDEITGLLTDVTAVAGGRSS